MITQVWGALQGKTLVDNIPAEVLDMRELKEFGVRSSLAGVIREASMRQRFLKIFVKKQRG